MSSRQKTFLTWCNDDYARAFNEFWFWPIERLKVIFDLQFILSYHHIDNWTNLEQLPFLELEYIFEQLKHQKELEDPEKNKGNALDAIAAGFEHKKKLLGGKDPVVQRQEELKKPRELKPQERIARRREKLAEENRQKAKNERDQRLKK